MDEIKLIRFGDGAVCSGQRSPTAPIEIVEYRNNYETLPGDIIFRLPTFWKRIHKCQMEASTYSTELSPKSSMTTNRKGVIPKDNAHRKP